MLQEEAEGILSKAEKGLCKAKRKVFTPSKVQLGKKSLLSSDFGKHWFRQKFSSLGKRMQPLVVMTGEQMSVKNLQEEKHH